MFLRHLYLLFITIGFSSTAIAQISNIEIETTIGFNQVFSLNSWTPITVQITNRDRSLQADLEVITTAGSEYQKNIRQRRHRLPIELNTNTPKTYSVTVQIASYAHPLIVKIVSNNRIISQQSINLRPYYTQSKLFLLLANSLPIDILQDEQADLKAAITHARYLPNVWYGYSGCKYAYLHPDYLKSLSNIQFFALKKWVQNGGRLIISNSYNQGAVMSERMRQLIILQSRGSVLLEHLTFFQRYLNVEASIDKPILLMNQHLIGGKTIIEEQNYALAQKIRFGRGTIIYFSMDLQSFPFKSWPQKSLLWHKLISYFPVDDDFIDYDLMTIKDTMIAAMPAEFPNGWILFGYLISFLIVVSVLVRKITESGGKSTTHLKMFISFCGIYIILGSTGYIYFFKTHHFTHNRFNRLQLYGNQQLAKSLHYLGFYSTENRQKAILLNGGPKPIQMIPHNKQSFQPHQQLNLTEYQNHQLLDINLEKWSYQFFQIGSVFKLPIHAAIKANKEELTVEINNKSSYTIQSCQLFFNGRFLSLPDIPAEKKTIVKFLMTKIMNKPRYLPEEGKVISSVVSNGGYFNLKKRFVFFQKEKLMAAMYEKYNGDSNHIHFWGWLDQKILDTNIITAKNTETLTLFEWNIPITSKL